MTNLFTNISPKNQDKILRILEATTLNFKPNCQILTSVKLENTISIVLSGYMQIIRTDYNGNRTIIEELTENDIFGSSISSITNECEIITKEETKIVVIDFNNILNDVENNLSYYKQFIKNLLEIYADKINKKKRTYWNINQKKY